MWNLNRYNLFIDELKSYSDDDYKDFSLRLIKTKYEMLGVRTPILDKLSKRIDDVNSFYNLCNFKYYEEVMILGFVIARIKDNEKRIKYFNRFILKIDNWAICDMVINRFKLKDEELSFNLDYIEKYIKSKNEFTIRCAYVFLLNYYVKEEYLDKIFELIELNKSNLYYVEMAIAWLLSYCYLVNKSKTLEFIKNGNISLFVYNKSIMKIRESLRVSKEEKIELKKLLKKE